MGEEAPKTLVAVRRPAPKGGPAHPPAASPAAPASPGTTSPPRRVHVPRSAQILLTLRALWIPGVWLGVALPWLGSAYANSGLLAELRESVDVPAQVVASRPVRESRGRTVRPWSGYRVTAEFEHGGAKWLAIGDMSKVPADGQVQARVPLSRPDLAVAFVGDGPHHNPEWIQLAILAGLGLLGVVIMVAYNLQLLRRMTHGWVVRAEHVAQRQSRSRHILRMRVPTPRGVLETEVNLSAGEAKRVLADPAPAVAYLDTKPHEVFALGELAGLRLEDDARGVSPVSWLRLLWAAVPVAIMVIATVYALKLSYQIDLFAGSTSLLGR